MVELLLRFVKFSRVFGDLCIPEAVSPAVPLPAGNPSSFLTRRQEMVVRQARMDLTTTLMPGALDNWIEFLF
jgi:hypothetical protein